MFRQMLVTETVAEIGKIVGERAVEAGVKDVAVAHGLNNSKNKEPRGSRR